MGPDVRPDLPILSILRKSMPEPASLDCEPINPTGNPFQAIDECLYQLLRSSTAARNRRFTGGEGSVAMWTKMAQPTDAVFHRARTPTSRRGTSAVLFSSGALRQSDLFTPRRRRSAHPAADGCQPHDRPAQ